MPYYEVDRERFTCFPMIDTIGVDAPRYFYDSAKISFQQLDPKASLHYTLDGSKPTAQSPRYEKPFAIEQTAKVQAAVLHDGKIDTMTLVQNVTQLKTQSPAIRPDDEGKSLEMVIPVLGDSPQIRYTTDGSNPTRQSPIYSEPIAMPAEGVVVKARLFGESGEGGPSSAYRVGLDDPWPLPQVHISDQTPVYARVGWGKLRPNHCINGKPLSMLGRRYEKGMGVHAVSDLVYDLPKDARQFVALVGFDDETHGRGSARCEVYIDDTLVYATGRLSDRAIWPIQVPIPAGAGQIRLHVTDGEDDYNWDWVDWVNAGWITGSGAE
jgi:hypothetical protein